MFYFKNLTNLLFEFVLISTCFRLFDRVEEYELSRRSIHHTGTFAHTQWMNNYFLFLKDKAFNSSWCAHCNGWRWARTHGHNSISTVFINYFLNIFSWAKIHLSCFTVSNARLFVRIGLIFNGNWLRTCVIDELKDNNQSEANWICRTQCLIDSLSSSSSGFCSTGDYPFSFLVCSLFFHRINQHNQNDLHKWHTPTIDSKFF